MGAFPLSTIAVIGGGACGWLAAATLARVLGNSCAVRVLELGGESGACAGVPSLHRLWRLLGIDEAALVQATHASYSLGTQFRDWDEPGGHYFHGFGAIGLAFGPVPFHQHWLRASHHGERLSIEDFSVAAQAARVSRFAPPQPDPRSLLSRYSFAWHFDGAKLAHFLRERALALGVTVHASDVAVVSHHGGIVHELRLADGSTLAADFFVDASGAREILRRALEIPFEDWSAWLPCDRELSLRVPGEGTPAPYAESTALTHGWLSHLPLRDGVELAYVYGSEQGDGDARAQFAAFTSGAVGTPRLRHLLRGRPRQFWAGNALLLPGETLDPLERTALHLAQSGITRWLAHFPVRRDSPTDAAEYNRLTVEEYDRVRDLLALHYHATGRDDSPLWRHGRAMALPETLRQRLELFADSGRLSIGEDEHCGLDGWLSVLLGQGVTPRCYDPLADVTPLTTMRAALSNLAAQIRAAVATLPTHADYLLARSRAP